MISRAVSVGALAPLVASAAAWGAEGESNLFAGDIGNAVWTLVIFFLVVLVLGKFAWGPLLDGLRKREQFIRDSLQDARRDRDEAEARLKELTDKLNAARAEASEIVDEGRRDAEVVRQKVEEESRRSAQEMIARAKQEIDLAKQEAIRELYRSSASLATDIAARIVGRELTAQDHERLLRESIEKLGEIDTH